MKEQTRKESIRAYIEKNGDSTGRQLNVRSWKVKESIGAAYVGILVMQSKRKERQVALYGVAYLSNEY